MTPDGPAKPCSKCGVLKAYTQYRRRSDRPQNVHAACKECERVVWQAYARAHPNRLREWRAANRERARKGRRDYEGARSKKQRATLPGKRGVRAGEPGAQDNTERRAAVRADDGGADASFQTGSIHG